MNKNALKPFVIVVFIFLFINVHLSAQPLGNDAVQIIESTNTHITFQVRIDSVLTNEKIIDQKTYHLISLPGFDMTTEPGKPQLPMTGLLLAVPAIGEINLRIIESQIASRSGLSILPAAEQILDEASQGEPQFVIDPEFYQRDSWYPPQLVAIGETGFIRDQRVAAVQICPVQFNPAQRALRIHESLTFRLDFEGATGQIAGEISPPEFEQVLKKLLPNYESGKNWRGAKTGAKDLPKAGQVSSASGRFKIYVKEDGIYRLTRSDLEQAGIIVSDIDPRTIKLFNRGRELPIFVPGQKDGSFDAADYLEFYGQHNRGENSYLSPYSISNVYWLDWGGGAGLRRAETDAGLYQTDPNRLVAPDCFRFTQHIEEDNSFDRLLLVTDESRDHWFWQTMNALRTYEFKFHLQHPVSDQLASVKVMMHGSTHPAPNPDHHTIVKINDYTIEDAFWDGQVEHLI